MMGGSGKAEGFAQALPMADGPTIGKLALAAATRNPRFQAGRSTAGWRACLAFSAASGEDRQVATLAIFRNWHR
jgi:hypothetical protein